MTIYFLPKDKLKINVLVVGKNILSYIVCATAKHVCMSQALQAWTSVEAAWVWKLAEMTAKSNELVTWCFEVVQETASGIDPNVSSWDLRSGCCSKDFLWFHVVSTGSLVLNKDICKRFPGWERTLKRKKDTRAFEAPLVLGVVLPTECLHLHSFPVAFSGQTH